jgi:hypothetical protein
MSGVIDERGSDEREGDERDGAAVGRAVADGTASDRLRASAAARPPAGRGVTP